MTPARMLGPLRGLVLALTAAGTLAASSAQAQLPGDNSNAPIDITANGLELIDAQRVQVWSGAVEAVQGTNRLRTELLRVFHAPKPGATPVAQGGRAGQWGEPQRMVAEGAVYFITPESTAKGNVAVYDLVRDVVTMTGDVVLTRGESVLRGDKLVIDVATGRSTLDSTAQGRGTNRVRGVFYPEERAAAAPAARAPVAPAVRR
jgi:lipopolysaccharide export system protein LptA